MILEIAVLGLGGLFALKNGLDQTKNAANDLISHAFNKFNQTILLIGIVTFLIIAAIKGSPEAAIRFFLFVANMAYSGYASIFAFIHLDANNARKLTEHMESALAMLGITSLVV